VTNLLICGMAYKCQFSTYLALGNFDLILINLKVINYTLLCYLKVEISVKKCKCHIINVVLSTHSCIS
jgi:hypothetical protein